jgi:hypothetical protein
MHILAKETFSHNLGWLRVYSFLNWSLQTGHPDSRLNDGKEAMISSFALIHVRLLVSLGDPNSFSGHAI